MRSLVLIVVSMAVGCVDPSVQVPAMETASPCPDPGKQPAPDEPKALMITGGPCLKSSECVNGDRCVFSGTQGSCYEVVLDEANGHAAYCRTARLCCVTPSVGAMPGDEIDGMDLNGHQCDLGKLGLN
jgi:hypothetical protein